MIAVSLLPPFIASSPRIRRLRPQPQQPYESTELRFRERLRENIGGIFFSGDIGDFEFFIFYCFTNEVVSEVDVLGTLMELVIF